ncbi:MAG TPA: argininosuccinate lyase [Phycisphaerae bacterium]|jgi:argininosuccinate lyase|nr:argininosuccinate lyase [Phycisphaerae bacterium]HOJ56790.1 argininosuccinate lyase [Phycisphaerae bacterium]HOL28526.1 argininosuccinate lyase [Phycisphaerae bacterium]HPP23051.1 argininosuccinate lyase [Phycisphaerae bacterium]HPU35016.1 argininosuccinate lyase [Phycisphaerae bacterium]
MSQSPQKSWQARFSQAADALTEGYVESLSFDQRLWRYDIAGSIAHAEMLADAGLITKADSQAIIRGLRQIETDIQAGQFKWDPAFEDIHMAVEAALVERVGEPGKRLHTARSRNDQVALDLRLYTRDAIDLDIVPLLEDLQRALVDSAEKYAEAVMPAYTHLQRAQPVTAGAYLLAYVEQFGRDRERFLDARKRVNVSPLGSGAVAGSTLPIDRQAVARRLGFPGVTRNSIDSISDRDFILEFLAAAALCAGHLSRLAEDWILFSSTEFQFVNIADAFCTGSSMMPQKKNPDVLELVRGKTGRIYAALTGMLMITKGLPQAYNRDLQEDKIHLFSAHDTLKATLEITAAVVRNTAFRTDRLAAATEGGYMDATILAEYLVGKGVPFREAHQHVGRLVAQAEKSARQLGQLSLDELQAVSDRIEADVFEYLGSANVVRRYQSEGNAGPDSTRRQIAFWREALSK